MMTSAKVATTRSNRNTKQSKVVNIAGDAALDRMSISRGPRSKARASGEGAHAAAVGVKANAIASGENAVAVAGGERAHAGLTKGDHASAVAAAGLLCIAQSYDSIADLAAVGNGATAISHHPGVAAVAVGQGAFAIAPEKGNAISIGYEASAMAGQGGYLIFIDHDPGKEPAVKVIKVDLFETGIRPDVPYWWKAGMDEPAVDTHRLQLSPL